VTMQVRLVLFAGLRQAAGFRERTVELPKGATVADLLATLDPALVRRTFYVAVNEEYAHRDTPLEEGDEVALLPPVSGGGAGSARGPGGCPLGCGRRPAEDDRERIA